MDKVLISHDQGAAAIVAAQWETERAKVQKVVDLYNAAGLPAMTAGGADLLSLLNKTAVFLFDKLTGGQAAHLTIGTGENCTLLPVDKHRAIEILTKPAGYKELIASLEELEKTKGNGWNIHQVSACFELDEAGNVALTERVRKMIDEAGKVYLSSERGKAIAAFVADVIKSYHRNGLDKHKTAIPGAGNSHTPVIDFLMLSIERMNEADQTWKATSDLMQRDGQWLKVGQ